MTSAQLLKIFLIRISKFVSSKMTVRGYFSSIFTKYHKILPKYLLKCYDLIRAADCTPNLIGT